MQHIAVEFRVRVRWGVGFSLCTNFRSVAVLQPPASPLPPGDPNRRQIYWDSTFVVAPDPFWSVWTRRWGQQWLSWKWLVYSWDLSAAVLLIYRYSGRPQKARVAPHTLRIDGKPNKREAGGLEGYRVIVFFDFFFLLLPPFFKATLPCGMRRTDLSLSPSRTLSLLLPVLLSLFSHWVCRGHLAVCLLASG